MGFFDLLKKKGMVKDTDSEIVAMADGELIDIASVKDPVFSEQALGQSVAFRYAGNQVTVCAPAAGELSVVYPTGHAFGVTMNNGMSLLVHIGINTVAANGDGFTVLKKEGDWVNKGDEVVRVDLKKLGAVYDMDTMLIITDDNDQKVTFVEAQPVRKGQKITK